MRKAIALGAALSLSMCVAAPLFAATYNIVGLGTLGGTSSLASDINNAGQVVGTAGTADANNRGFLYSNGVMQDLGSLSGFPTSQAYGINNAGQVVGWSIIIRPVGIYETRAFLYQWQMQDLGTLGGDFSVGIDINDVGQVVGNSSTADANMRAFLYSNGVMQDLGTLGGASSFAIGINNVGQVVGNSSTADANIRAFLYSNGVMQNLGTLGGTSSDASDINDVGQVVGTSSTTGEGASRAFLYSNGVMQDLNTLIASDSGWVLTSPFKINDSGQIIGAGFFNGQERAFLATPVPLPGAVWMMASGLAGLGVVGRVRCNRARG
jgi:probable HAF family extracellular repeat protein